MSLLRIKFAAESSSMRCEWALLGAGREPIFGEGTLAQVPRRAERVQLVLPATQVVLVRARLPRAARQRRGAVLAYAIEEQIVGDPHASRVTWLGMDGDDDMLAVLEREGLERWREALRSLGFKAFGIYCETLMLPLQADTWSLAWDGREGFVRTGEFEGAATDCGDQSSPPLSLQLRLEEARARGRAPSSLTVYTTATEASPALGAWQGALGVSVHLGGAWDWRSAPPEAGVALGQEHRRWRLAPDTLAHLRPAAWLLVAALAVQAVALALDWGSLSRQQRALRRRMVAEFRATFPRAVAVVDPELQMRRDLAQARHAAGRPDPGDFLPMLERVAETTRTLPAGSLRTLSYENDRMTLALRGLKPSAIGELVARVDAARLRLVEAPVDRRGTVTLQVRPR